MFFYAHENDPSSLIEELLQTYQSSRLTMIRGQRDTFFMSVRDSNMESDSLEQVFIRSYQGPQTQHHYVETRKVSVAYTG